jgi:hypothetical protein
MKKQAARSTSMAAKSLAFHISRSGEIHVFDPEQIPHHEDIAPIMLIAAEIICAGYGGVAIDEMRLANGRYFQSLDADISTPEGKLIMQLFSALENGARAPNSKSVLEELNAAYAADQFSEG